METNGVVKKEKDFDIMVKMASDYYEAFISIASHDIDAVIVLEDEILAALKAKSITFGIDYQAITSIVQNPRFASDISVARGIRHVNGIDGTVTYLVNSENNTKPKELENGTVDFKNMDFVHAVKRNEILAKRTMPTEGTKGTTVTGRVVATKNGKIINFKFGKNVILTEDGLTLIAAVDGTVDFNGEKISVIEVLEIRGDVGVKTGNIKFSGKVIVQGNVTSGYIVESDDTIEINGIVESAEVYAENNIIVNGGIQGNDNCIIKAGGEITCNYINNCEVHAGKGITTNSIMHSTVYCDDTINCRNKKGLIIGGEIIVRHNIFAKTIGSEMGTITKLRLGINAEIIEEFQRVVADVKQINEDLKKINQAVNLLTKQLSTAPNNEQIKNILKKTQDTKVEKNNTLKTANGELKDISELIESLQDSKVEASDIYPGVKVKIGNSYYNVRDHLQRVAMKKDKGEIILLSS